MEAAPVVDMGKLPAAAPVVVLLPDPSIIYGSSNTHHHYDYLYMACAACS
jgi:hypothetical protein